jgi:SAM-dependent methyltransferase
VNHVSRLYGLIGAPIPHFVNRTRQSTSIPLKLLKRGRVLEIPLYYALRLSDLAREGIDHSGSFRFADHIYRGEPSGRGPLGRWLDARLLSMPAARSFRNRYLAAAGELTAFLASRSDRPIDVLSVPCGIPRELAAGARAFVDRHGGSLAGVTFHGLDLDRDVLDRAGAFAAGAGLPAFVTHQGDALTRSSYPDSVDFITCTGFGEFLDDSRLERLYGIVFAVLRPGGLFVTSAMRRHWASAYFLRLAELETHYRAAADLEAIVRRLPFRELSIRSDNVGLQTILTARR